MLISDDTSPSIFSAGFADGVIKVFDRRLEEENAIIRAYNHNTSWVQNVKWHPTLPSQFLSSRFVSIISLQDFCHWPYRSVDGDIKLWDIRGNDREIRTWEPFPQGLSSFDVHPQTGVFAAWVIWLRWSQIVLMDMGHRTSSLSTTNWRMQRTVVHSLTRSDSEPLNTVPSIITFPPSRESLTALAPLSSSLSFHPREMVFAMGSVDGSGK